MEILERREYTGCTVNFKTYTNSIWDKKQRNNPIEKQAIFPNTHERILDDDVFEKVQEIRQQRHRMICTGRSSIFSGLIYCADCSSKMLYGSSNNGDLDQDFLTAPCTAKAKKSVMVISFASRYWSGGFSSTFKRLWGISCSTRIISARSWRNSSAWKAMSKSASAESVWKATNAVLPSCSFLCAAVVY